MSIIGDSQVSQLLRDNYQFARTSDKFTQISRQLSTGKRYQSLKDYGVFVSKIINLEGVISRRESYMRAIDLVSFNVESYQETLAEIDEITTQGLKLANQPVPDSTNTEALRRWQTNVDVTANLLLRQLTEVLNTSLGDKYLYAGNRFSQPAVKELQNLDTFDQVDVRNPMLQQEQSLNNLPQGSVMFAVGESTKQVTVRVSGDFTPEEFEERLQMHLDSVVATDSTATVSSITQSTASTLVQDNDTTYSIHNSGIRSVQEGGEVVFAVRRQGGDLSGTGQVGYSLLNGANVTAGDLTLGTGFNTVAGTIDFAAGATEVLVTVDTTDDGNVESLEHFGITLEQNNAYLLDADHSAIGGTINDNDSLKEYITIETQGATTIDEDNGAATPHVFVIRRQNPGAGNESKTVSWRLDTDKSTADAADFGGTIPSGQVTFVGNETEKRITIYPSTDQQVESSETFQIKVSGEDVIQSHAEGTIINDEVSYGIEAIAASAAEGGTSVFRVTRNGDFANATSIDASIVNRTTDAADGLAIGTSAGASVTGTITVNFAAGETEQLVTVTSTQDATNENDEEFSVQLATPAATNEYLNAFASSATGTVVNDDNLAGGIVSIAANTTTVTETNDGSHVDVVFTITRSDDTKEEFVNYSTQQVSGDSTDTHDFTKGYGMIPTIKITDAGGTTQEQTYIFDTVPGERDPLVWQKQEVSLRDGQSREYGITASNPAFQKLIKSLLIMKSIVETRNAGNEGDMLQTAYRMLTEAQASVRQLVAENAIEINGIETARLSHQTFNALAKNKLADITEIDPAEAAASLTALQAQVNASYTLIAKRAKLSLANYL